MSPPNTNTQWWLGGSYVGVWNVAGNPAGVIPVTKENSIDQVNFFQISQKYLTNYNQANFFKYLKNLTDYNQANFFKCLTNLTNCNQANLDKYPVSGDICHRYYLFTIIEGFWDYQVVRVRFLPFCSETLQFNVSTLFAVKTCVSWRWVRDATRGATGCPIGIQVIINSLQLLLEFRKTPSCRKGIL